MSRTTDHVDAFNQAVSTGDWDTFAARFAPDATMTFVNVPAGPFHGREAIAEAYRATPPTETMSLVEEVGDFARFRWSGGGTGTMRLVWTPNGTVRTLTVSFD
ncbi:MULTISPECIES: nuclear transport factor 2 family protein [unclassified Kribbella]|uniref:nuclear transport factor 2 family protein n=1 Tax=unclassified Kribbella TaxID=2644121 RepID=UPI003404C315